MTILEEKLKEAGYTPSTQFYKERREEHKKAQQQQIQKDKQHNKGKQNSR